MKQEVSKALFAVENQFDVKIVYACESGSRAYGLSSPKSDYDLRFIYVHRKEDYLSIDEKRDVIEVPITGGMDSHGWDLRKALKLLRKSNPSLLEWLNSSVIYYDDSIFLGKIRELALEGFSPKVCMHHYWSMGKGNYKEYLKSNVFSTKKLFRGLRPILICVWIEEKETFPPMVFQQLAKDVLPEKLFTIIYNLIEKLRIGEGEGSAPKEMKFIHDFMDRELQRLEGELLRRSPGDQVDLTPKLDNFFKETLDRIWITGN